MSSYTCIVRVHLPRPLFRRLMARAILERTDVSSIVIRALRSELLDEGRVRRRKPGAPEKGAGPG